MSTILEIDHLSRTFQVRGRRKKTVQAVRDLSFSLQAGESLGLVGESGSGKTTTARIVCGLETLTSGEVKVAGFEVGHRTAYPRAFYDQVQLIFQDPYLSLNPRQNVGDTIGYSLKVRGVAAAERRERVQEAVARVGLPGVVLERYPHQLSTGQRQRVGIARAIVGRPALIVADEPVSSLDVSLQTQILNLLADIQDETHVSYLFISHDLAAVAYLCDRVVVMRNGESVEQGRAEDVFAAPQTDYARLLVEAASLEPQVAAAP